MSSRKTCSLKTAVSAIVIAVAVTLGGVQYMYGPLLDQLGNVCVGYVARTVCSGVFIGNRRVQSVLDGDISSLARSLSSCDVDYENRTVRAKVALGLYSGVAKYHGVYTGCSVISDIGRYESEDRARFDNFYASLKDSDTATSDGGEELQPLLENNSPALQKVVDGELSRRAYDKGHSRALVVVHHGRIVAEGYATEHVPDITASTRHLGWSMTKSVLAILVGMRIHDGRLALDDIVYRNFTLRSLLNMVDILPIPEQYGMTAPLPRMLYTERSVLEFIDSFADAEGRVAGGLNNWYYSTSLTNIISNVLRQTFNSTEEYWRYPREQLFEAIGATSVVMETDQSGLFVASTFGYATARDWARLGLLVLNRGEWAGRRLLTEEYADFMMRPTPASGHMYGGQMWCASTEPLPQDAPEHVLYERVSVDQLASAVPAGMCYFSGHNGQFVIMIPSASLVVARLGYTEHNTAPRDPALWPAWQPPWNVAGFMEAILSKLPKT